VGGKLTLLRFWYQQIFVEAREYDGICNQVLLLRMKCLYAQPIRLRSVQFRCNGPIRKHVRSVQQHYSNSLPFALPTIIEKSDCLYLLYEK
jgi:hypothetical protein